MDNSKNNQSESPPNHLTVDKEGNWWLPDGTMSIHSPTAKTDILVTNSLKSMLSGNAKQVRFRH